MGNNYFQMPEFNFRLRRALDPFGNQDSGRKFGTVGDTFANNAGWGQEEEEETLPDLSMGRIPSFGRFYDEEGPAIRRYKSYLQGVPKPESYAPSKWRRLGAILSGTSAALKGGDGYSAAREIIRDPYETAYQDWARGGQGLKEAATMEEATAKNRASTYQKILSDYMEQRKWQADYEIKLRNAKTTEERNAITKAYNEAMAGYRQRMLDLTGKRDENTAKYQQGMLGNAATANNLRKYGIETARYTAQKQRELAERQGQYGPISGANQRDAQQLATDQMFQEMSSDPAYADNIEDYFILDENGAPVMAKGTLPGKYAQKFTNAVNQSYVFSGRR